MEDNRFRNLMLLKEKEMQSLSLLRMASLREHIRESETVARNFEIHEDYSASLEHLILQEKAVGFKLKEELDDVEERTKTLQNQLKEAENSVFSYSDALKKSQDTLKNLEDKYADSVQRNQKAKVDYKLIKKENQMLKETLELLKTFEPTIPTREESKITKHKEERPTKEIETAKKNTEGSLKRVLTPRPRKFKASVRRVVSNSPPPDDNTNHNICPRYFRTIKKKFSKMFT